jgi:hypothetical protein
MRTCPNCQREVEEEHIYCKYCGTKITKTSIKQKDEESTPQPIQDKEREPADKEIIDVIVNRVEGIKNRNANAISVLVDRENYTKFDDWPPYELLGIEGLKMEADALQTLESYDYYLTDFNVKTLNDVAICTCLISYRLTIKRQVYAINSRISTILRKREDGWKIVHEHWGRIPQAVPGLQRRRVGPF